MSSYYQASLALEGEGVLEWAEEHQVWQPPARFGNLALISGTKHLGPDPGVFLEFVLVPNGRRPVSTLDAAEEVLRQFHGLPNYGQLGESSIRVQVAKQWRDPIEEVGAAFWDALK